MTYSIPNWAWTVQYNRAPTQQAQQAPALQTNWAPTPQAKQAPAQRANWAPAQQANKARHGQSPCHEHDTIQTNKGCIRVALPKYARGPAPGPENHPRPQQSIKLLILARQGSHFGHYSNMRNIRKP